MADIIYTVNQDSPENIPGFEQYSQEDKALINSFQVNSVFNTNKNYSELHILSLSDELLESVYNYTNFTQLGNAQSSGQEGASVLTIDPIADSKAYGYENGGVKLLYHFLDDLYTEDSSKVEFYIQDISPDRTELSLATLLLTSQSLVDTTGKIKTNLESQSYFTGFRLDFKNNDLFIATNIDTLDSSTGKVVVVKLYEPLPDTYGIKSTLNIVGEVSDSVAYEVDALITVTPSEAPTLRSPNFNIDIADESVIPTGYYNYNELFSYPVNNANSQIFSTVKEKGIDISVDYADFTDFIHFSSAQERLLNFKYKLDLITSYSASLSSIASSTTGLQGISGSRTYYENLQSGVVSNFDHYERFLYYESGSGSWPKSNTTKPYINKVSTSAEAITWYAGQISNAIEYDLNNYNSLVYSIPTYLRDDANNENYLTFVYMVGQHFDNLWLYSKAVTDKYDADNRIDKGISKDLVAEALKNFGVKLYTSNKSVEDLFSTFIGQAYQSGSEKIKTYITGSLTGSNTPIQPSSFDNYQKEIQKRIYHNLPLLLKSKGTERGLRALINCLGIPGDILDIKLYGGRNIKERPFFGDYQYYTSSLDKIRLDNTGSIVTGSTLSNYVSIIKRDPKYTDDLHAIEVGFSPTDNIDQYIITHSSASFNIDQYLGDPRNLTLDNYVGLDVVAQGILSSLDQYNLQDYVRLIKFFDNVVFKTVKDFIPARVTADTGIIIKPNLLNRSKANSVILTGTRPEYTGSIDTAFISGSNAGSFGINDGFLTSYLDEVVTPLGPGLTYTHTHEEPKYDGEFQNSEIIVSTVDLNLANTFKYPTYNSYLYDVRLWDSTVDVCIFTPGIETFYVTSSTRQYYGNDFFHGGVNILSTYTSISPAGLPTTPIMPVTFAGYPQYQTIPLTVSNGIIDGNECTDEVSIIYGVCDIAESAAGVNVQAVVPSTVPVNIANWFTIAPGQTRLKYYISNTNTAGTTILPAGSIYAFAANPPVPATAINVTFDYPQETVVTIVIKDEGLGGLCEYTKSVVVSSCTIVPHRKPSSYIPAPTVPLGQVSSQFFLVTGVGLASYFTGVDASTYYYVVLYGISAGDIAQIYEGLNITDLLIPGAMPTEENSSVFWVRIYAVNTGAVGCTRWVDLRHHNNLTFENGEHPTDSQSPPGHYFILGETFIYYP